MASASAIPMMAITKMLPNALGLRPTASAALPPTIPTPTPAPRPANANGRNGPKFPASAAIIGRVSNMLFTFRFLFFSFRLPTRSMVSAGKFLMRSLAPFVFRRELDINGAEHREDERLEKTYQQLEEVKR